MNRRLQVAVLRSCNAWLPTLRVPPGIPRAPVIDSTRILSKVQFEAGLRAHERGVPREAEKYYRLALEADADNLQALHMAGVLALQTGEHDVAVLRLSTCIDRGVADAGTWLLLGRALAARGDVREAIGAYSTAIELAPDMTDAHVCLGIALGRGGDWDAAVNAHRAALATAPRSPLVLVNLGNALLARGDAVGALQAYDQGLELTPTSAALHYNRGRALRVLERDRDAAAAFQLALDHDPAWLAAAFNVGNVLVDLGRHRDALHAYDHVIACCARGEGRPLEQGSLEELGRAAEEARIGPLCWTYDYDAAHAPLQEALAARPHEGRLHEFRLLLLPYRYTSRSAVAEAYRAYRRLALPLPRAATGAYTAMDGPLRVGLVSADLRDHSMSFFLEPLLAAHSRDHVALTVFCNNPGDDAVTERLRALTGSWVDIRDLEDEAVMAQIRERGIQVLVDLSGRTSHNRLGLFMRQSAPVQVSYLGYPTYTGVDRIGWRITDDSIDPHDGDFPDERPLRLGRSQFCYRPPATLPPLAARRAVDAGCVRFGSFNQLAKLSPPLLEAWAELLGRLPRSRLLIKAHSLDDADTRQRIEARFEALGVSAGRVELRSAQADRAAHLAMYGEVDIALDTYPYNGATTTCEALWMGVPVVSWVGETHASRMGLSLLAAIGLEELACDDVDGYVECAERLALDPARLLRLQSGLRDRCESSPLRDETGFARAFERALERAWRSQSGAGT